MCVFWANVTDQNSLYLCLYVPEFKEFKDVMLKGAHLFELKPKVHQRRHRSLQFPVNKVFLQWPVFGVHLEMKVKMEGGLKQAVDCGAILQSNEKTSKHSDCARHCFVESDSYFCIFSFLIQFSPIRKKTDQFHNTKNNNNNQK